MQKALGELVSSLKEGLLARGVGVRLGVLAELMDEEVQMWSGRREKDNAAAVAVRAPPGARRSFHPCSSWRIPSRTPFDRLPVQDLYCDNSK